MSKVYWLIVFALFVASPGVAAQETVERYAGLSSIAGEPPFKTFAEIRRSGTAVSGYLKIPGEKYEIQNAQVDGDRIRGKLVADARTAGFDLLGRTRTVQLQLRTVVDADWIKPKSDAPLWKHRRIEQFWTIHWVDLQTLYVGFRGYEELARNTELLFGELDRLRPARLIIDIRDNGGGDYEKGRRLLIDPIKRRPWINSRGRLFVMIGRKTFSAAMVNAVDFDVMTEALLVGEPIGEQPNSYQEVRQFTLANSGLTVGVSTKWYAFMPGDTGK